MTIRLFVFFNVSFNVLTRKYSRPVVHSSNLTSGGGLAYWYRVESRSTKLLYAEPS